MPGSWSIAQLLVCDRSLIHWENKILKEFCCNFLVNISKTYSVKKIIQHLIKSATLKWLKDGVDMYWACGTMSFFLKAQSDLGLSFVIIYADLKPMFSCINYTRSAKKTKMKRNFKAETYITLGSPSLTTLFDKQTELQTRRAQAKSLCKN